MKRVGNVGVILGLMCALAGCSEDWSGRYTGMVTTMWQRRVMTEPGAADTQNGADMNSSSEVTVRRIDERHYLLVTPYCELRTQQEPAPNLHNGRIEDGQSCTVPVGDTQMPIEVTGSVQFGTDDSTLQANFHGEHHTDANGIPDGDYALFRWTFEGEE